MFCNQIIVNAIKNKNRLSLVYDNINRTVEPHAYGETKAGNGILRCYQVCGNHNSDKPHDWELLSVSKITGLTLTEERFLNARPGYKKNDKAMTIIYAQI